MIHAPSGIAQAEANVRVWVGTRPRCSSGSTAVQIVKGTATCAGLLGAIGPLSHTGRGRGRLLARLPYEQQPTRGHLLCLVFDGHRGFVLFGAVTCACIQRASGIRGLWLGARTEPAVLCGAASAAQYGQNGMLMLTSFFFALWRWRRWQTIEKPGVESVASTAIDELNSGLGC